MVEPVAFAYRPGDSLLHRCDARAKTVALLVVSVALMAVGFDGLALAAPFLVLGLRQATFPILAVAAQIRYFLVLLLIVFVTRALVTPGEPLLEITVLTVTQ